MTLLHTNTKDPRLTGRSRVSLRELNGKRLLFRMDGNFFIFHFDKKVRAQNSLKYSSRGGLFISFAKA